MTKLLLLIIVSSLLLAAGCATTQPTPGPEDDTALYLSRFDRIWEVTLSVLEEDAIKVKSMDKGKGVIITSFVNYSVGHGAHHAIDEIAERPLVRLAIFTQVSYRLTISITPVSEMSTMVRVIATIEAYDSNMTKTWHQCPTKNVLEYRLQEKIRSRI